MPLARPGEFLRANQITHRYDITVNKLKFMSEKKIIVVFGATGAQGGGLARAILNDSNSEFAVRAVTRDPNSDKAKELAAMGAEVVAGDVDDTESMKRVLQGAYGAYFVTFFWAHFSAEKETSEAKKWQQLQRSRPKHVIWSTLEDVRNYVPLDDNSACQLCMGNIKFRILMVKGDLIIILLMPVCRLLLC